MTSILEHYESAQSAVPQNAAATAPANGPPPLSAYDKMHMWKETYAAVYPALDQIDHGDQQAWHETACEVADMAVCAMQLRWAAWHGGPSVATGDFGVLREFVRDALRVWDDDASGQDAMDRSMDALRKAARL